MKIDAEKVNVVHNAEAERFEIAIGDELCVLEYQVKRDRIFFTHTGVPPALEGQGLANRLAKTALDYAREKEYRVVPACEFMEVYIRRHPEYRDLLHL
jgi:predicted GNAT family acetyltransferase